ncbi:MAG: GNAT family N-acetyltransferase [Candidatus Cloacimonadaceae bacterium]|jgi:hypothetical protein
MDYKIITTTEDFDSLKPDWERIENQSNNLTYFSTFKYAKGKWDILKNYDKYKLCIFCVIFSNVVVGIAPLMLVRMKNKFFSWNSLQFLASCDYADFIIDEQCQVRTKVIYKQLFDAIFAHKDLWDELDLDHIPYTSNLIYYLFCSQYNKKLYYFIENPYIEMSKIVLDNTINKAKIPEKTIQYSNRLKKFTNYELIVTNENCLSMFAPIHIAEKEYWHKKGLKQRHSLFEDKERNEVLNNLFNLGNTLSYYLKDTISNKIIIYNCGYLYKNIFYSLNTGFEPEYAGYGAGKIIYYEILKENLLHPLWNVLDAGTGRYPWKFEWATGFNLLYRLYIINPNCLKLKGWQKLRNIKRDIMNE